MAVGSDSGSFGSALRVSVIVCTLGRSPWLSQLLQDVTSCLRECDEAILVLSGPGIPWGPYNGRIQVIPVEATGLSTARNSAIDSACGDVLVFFDDDVTIENGCLAAFRGAFTNPAIGYAGGPIAVDMPLPSWVVGAGLAWMYGYLDKGTHPRILAPDERVYGANMALRREALDGLRFRTDLGYVSTKRRGGGEDLELQMRLESTGWTGAYVANARVVHHVSARRNALAWQASRCFQEGAALARQSSPREEACWQMRSLWRTLAQGNARAAVCYAAAAFGAAVGSAVKQ